LTSNFPGIAISSQEMYSGSPLQEIVLKIKEMCYSSMSHYINIYGGNCEQAFFGNYGQIWKFGKFGILKNFGKFWEIFLIF
jgi:hypothetical protein